MIPLFDVFQKGLIRGSARLPFDPEKAYAYVEHPQEGWRVYLRSTSFLRPVSSHRKTEFLVVKRTGARMTTAAWEPPKGQMERKDIMRQDSLLPLLSLSALREVEEESHISHVLSFHHTGLVFQSQEPSYPRHHYFQYHVFEGTVSDSQVNQSMDTFEWIKAHPKAFHRWTRDRREKDGVAWFDPKKTRLNMRWCPSIVALYLRAK